jgi:hypothetical protein
MHRALRRLGELMAAQPKAKPPGGSKKHPKKDRVVSGPDPLLDLGIDKHLADRARKAAATPEDKYEAQTNKAINIAVALGGSNFASVHQVGRGSTRDGWWW